MKNDYSSLQFECFTFIALIKSTEQTSWNALLLLFDREQP